MRRVAVGVLVAGLFGSVLVGCGGGPEVQEATPPGPAGSYQATLVAGGGKSLAGPDARARLLRIPVDNGVSPRPVEFAVAIDGAVWVAVGSPEVENSTSRPRTLGAVEALVRIDSSGTVLDVDFDFVDPVHVGGGLAGEHVVILSGPVADDAGGVVVVVGPEPDSALDPAPAWSKLYRVDPTGDVALVDLPEEYMPTGVGQSAAGGFLVQGVTKSPGPCQRVFKFQDENKQFVPVAGRDCALPLFEPQTIAEAKNVPLGPLAVQINYASARGLRTALLPDGRVVILYAGVGLFIEGADGMMQLAVEDAPNGKEDPATGVVEPSPSWVPLVADVPFDSFGYVSELYSTQAQFSVSSTGQIALLLDSMDTPAMDSNAFHLELRDVPPGNNAQINANELILAEMPGLVPDGLKGPASEGRARGSGVAVFDPAAGAVSSDWPVSLVSGYGNLCQWRGEGEIICAIAGYAEDPNAGAMSAILVAIRVP